MIMGSTCAADYSSPHEDHRDLPMRQRAGEGIARDKERACWGLPPEEFNVTLTKEEHELLSECEARNDLWALADMDSDKYPALKSLGRLRLIDAKWPIGQLLPSVIWITEFGRNVLKDLDVENEKDS